MIYLDYNASTPVDPRVLEVVYGAMRSQYANPSSTHGPGQEAAESVENARRAVSRLVGARPAEVVFTSGASEALTLAIVGAALADPDRPEVVVSAIEHKAALTAAEPAARLSGGRRHIVSADSSGVVSPDAVELAVSDRTAIVCVMLANNETGVVQPIEAIAEVAHRAGALLLCDVTQGAGKLPIDQEVLAADLLTLSSHKIYGPKGSGALIGSRQVLNRLVPIFPGGGQERGLRGGTLDTPAIAGFGRAAELAHVELDADAKRASNCIERLLGGIEAAMTDVVVVGGSAPRLANTLNLRFIGADADAVIASMPEVAVSTGSACQAAVPTVSHVLLAMGLNRSEASECIRFSVGRFTTSDEIDAAVNAVVSAVHRVRALSAA